ncbi:MAG: hypothetical protein GX644_15560 [Limnobacter sp.]|nr:hypothetical protein [Limnobacter sp.]
MIMAVCMGGLAFGLVKLSRNRLPRWLIPAFAAAGMLGYLAYYDYTWYGFKRNQLPDGAAIVAEHREASFFRPWSYVFPSVNSFTVLDGKFSEKAQDGRRLVEYFEYTFRKDPIEGLDTQAFVLNCESLERVPFDHLEGRISGAVQKMAEHDLIVRRACD